MNLFALAASGFAAGSLHVLSGPDHLAAVAPIAVLQKRRKWLPGARWGLGHSTGVVLVGILALALRELIDVERLSAFSEQIVGFTLIGIGAWGLRRAWFRRHDAKPLGDARLGEHVGEQDGHSHHLLAAFSVGTLHGLAGGSHILGILPALSLPTRIDAALYLLFFTASTIAAMAAFSWFVAGMGAKAAHGRPSRIHALLGVISFVAIAVGVNWLR